MATPLKEIISDYYEIGIEIIKQNTLFKLFSNNNMIAELTLPQLREYHNEHFHQELIEFKAYGRK